MELVESSPRQNSLFKEATAYQIEPGAPPIGYEVAQTSVCVLEGLRALRGEARRMTVMTFASTIVGQE
ncbi:MAG: hypothetical protein AABN33_09750 [Acidobacteriota bacterium]